MICEDAYQYQQLHGQKDHMMMDLSTSPPSSPISPSSSPKSPSYNINEEERLEVVNLSGMALQSLPNPSLNLANICKLDLSNNHIKTFVEVQDLYAGKRSNTGSKASTITYSLSTISKNHAAEV